MLFDKFSKKGLTLDNRVVMAPLTRSRAIGNVPNDLMVTYYAQRAGAGLIISEGTSPSPNGLGYPRIPGVFNAQQVTGWRRVTNAVHAKGGKIFQQLMHTGRVSHPLNLPENGRVLAPSAVALQQTKMYTDEKGQQPISAPTAMNKQDIAAAKEEHVQAARNAIEAGFDGVELHGANGYLLEQFINPAVNQREDEYGGSLENRARFALEVAEAVVAAIGAEKVGIRLSPYGVFNEMSNDYPEQDATYHYLAEELGKLDLLYIHLVDHSGLGTPEVPTSIKREIRDRFPNLLILSGNYDAERAEEDLRAGHADLIAFGRPFIANPDLVTRMREGEELAQPNPDTFYTPGPDGYVDYPVLAEEQVG